MPEQLKYLILLFPIVGVGLFVGGAAYRRRLKEKVMHCERTTGAVIDNVAGMAGGFDTSPVYRPVVEYFVGSTRFTLTGDTGYGQRKEKGTRLTVMFSPENPSFAFIVEDYYLAADMLLGIGGMFVLLGSLFAYHLLL